MADRTAGDAKNLKAFVWPSSHPGCLEFPEPSHHHEQDPKGCDGMNMLQVEEETTQKDRSPEKMRIHARERRKEQVCVVKGQKGARKRLGTRLPALESLARSDGPETSYPTCQIGGRLTFSTAPDPAVREERLRPRSGGGVLVEAASTVTGSGHVDLANGRSEATHQTCIKLRKAFVYLIPIAGSSGKSILSIFMR
jgi:hypothetical protein